MTIKKVNEDLMTAIHPVAKVLHKGDRARVLIIGFKEGMTLKEHQAHLPSKLTVLAGKVVYKQGEKRAVLSLFDEVEIPINVSHSVEAIENSLCLLTQG
jgi:quercetin dioxygenase-like cupin family protein